MSTHENLRLRVLLAWAFEFVERETDALAECHSYNGIIDEIARADVLDARRWLAEAEEMGIETGAING